MSPSRNFIRFVHKVDIYEKITVTNDMGQHSAIWNLVDQDVEGAYIRSSSSTGIRITPTTDESDYYFLYLNHDIDVNYGTRFKNVRTRVGDEKLSDEWIQVVQIDREIAFSGKVQYLELKVKSVIE
jgi:hypothetical protein